MRTINFSRIKRDKPAEIMLHSADTKLTVAQVEWWLEILIKIEMNFSILVRDETSFKTLIKKFPKLQILYADTPIDIEKIVNIQPKLRKILYISNRAKNIHILRFNHLKHIFIGTKNSDWLSNFNKSYRAYDEFWGAGKYVIERFNDEVINTAHLKFKIVGKPQIKTILESISKEKNSVTVLVEQKKSILSKTYILNHSNELKTFIYLNNKNLKEDLSNALKSNNYDRKIVLFDSKDLFNEFALQSLYIITDIKNLSPYFLSYQIPILVYIDDDNDITKINPQILADACYFWKNREELNQIIKELENQDSLLRKREEIFDFLFDKEATLKEKFFQEMEKI